MPKYSVTVIFDACKCVEVEAESPEQAVDMAYDEAGYVGLCHQCSGEVEMGDAVRAIVYDESGEEVADDGYQAVEVAKITQQRDWLLAALETSHTVACVLMSRFSSVGMLQEWNQANEMAEKIERAIAKANGV